MDMLKNATVSDVHSPGALGGERRKGQRRILRRLRIDEVSAVDFPAQAHARALIIKRHAPDEPEIADDGLSDTEAAIAKRAAAGESYFMAAANVYAERDRRAGESMEKARERFYSTEKGRYLREVAKAAPASWYAKPREEDKAPGPGQHARTNTPAKSRPEDRAPGAGQHAPTNTFAKPREEDKAPEGPARKSLNDRAREMMAADKRLTREKAVARIAESRSSSDQACGEMLGPRLAHDRESCAIRHCAQVRSQPPGGASNQVTGGSERRGNSFIARGRSRLPSNGIKQMAFTLSGFRINIPWRALVSRVAPDQLSYITELASHSTIALQVDMT